MQWAKTRMKFRVCEIHQVQRSKDKKHGRLGRVGNNRLCYSYIWQIGQRIFICQENLLITTLIYKDFQLTMKGKEILKETHTVSTLKVIVKFRHTSVKDGIVDPVFR